MNNIKITAKKELRSIFRDRKTLILLFVMPLMIPLLIFFYGLMFDNIEEESKTTNTIGINYQLSDVEKELIKENKIEAEYIKEEDKLKEKLDNDEISAYIIYDKAENKYFINYSDTAQTSQIVLSKITSYLESYNKTIALDYIKENKLDSQKIYNNINYEIVESESENYILSLIFSIAFTYTIMAIVIAGSNMALSATATEKENGTLETILTLPVKTSELILGKYLAATIMGFIVSLFSLLITAVSIIVSSKVFKTFEAFKIDITPTIVIYSVVILLSASILISGLAIALTAFCKTTKEAQSKVQFLNYITLIPMFVSLLEVEISKLYYLIPVCNYVQILMDIFSNKADIINLLLMFSSSIIYISIIIKAIISQYKSEKVLFAN